MRVCLEKSTGKLIDSQSGGKVERLPKNKEVSDKEYAGYLAGCDALEANRLNTLLQNAINQGYKEADIEVKFVTDAEFQIIMDAIPKPEKTSEQLNEEKIQAKIRELAIQSLKASGELPQDYK